MVYNAFHFYLENSSKLVSILPTECQDITQNRTLKIWVLINHCIDLLTKTTSILCLCTICFRQKPYQELTVSYINFITQSQTSIEQLLWHSSGEADTTFHFYPVWFWGVVVCLGFLGVWFCFQNLDHNRLHFKNKVFFL